MKINKETIKRRSAYVLFWSWHLIYTVLAVAVIFPYTVIPLFEQAIKLQVPWHYVVDALMMFLLPFVSMFLGAKIFHSNFRHLMKYFYGFEMPLLLFLIVRMMTFRDAGLGMTWLIANVLFALSAWLIFLWLENKAEKPTLALADNAWSTVGSTIIAMVGAYLGALFFIIMLPLAGLFFTQLLKAVTRVSFDDFYMVFFNPLAWLGMLFALLTMALLLAVPVVMIRLYLGQFIQRFPSFFAPKYIAIILAVVIFNSAGFVYFNQQPQQKILALLDEKMQHAESEIDLLQQEEPIRQGLLNAYLARYRYVSTQGKSNVVEHLYKDAFDIEKETAAIPQGWFNHLALPFLYQEKNWDDVDKAEDLYADFFDTPIQKAEREIILAAVKANWEVAKGNEAGLLDAANHYVHVAQQVIDVVENNDVATINITHVLENNTYQQQEVVLHFSLPDDAVVTGLWLSDDAEQRKKFPFVLAPKGAAQAVYKSEVNRRVDPALLEQTGPNQYRLRAYPVLAKLYDNKKSKLDSPPLYVQFEYQTLANKAGAWPLPSLLEQRNIFWDKATERVLTVNGKQQSSQQKSFAWLPISLQAQTPAKPNQALVFHQDGKTLRAIPRQHNKEVIRTDKVVAVLIDGSYSMNEQRDAVLTALMELKTAQVTYDVYFCRQHCQPIKNADQLDAITFFGRSQTADHLTAFSQITAKQRQYDATLLLTDSGSYELVAKATKEATETLKFKSPIWLIHLGKTLPYAYDDKVLDVLYRSKGGITASVKEALLRVDPTGLIAEHSYSTTDVFSLSKDRLWVMTNTVNETSKAAIVSRPELDKLAVAQRVKHLSRTMDTQKLDNLDAIHQLAKTHGIVTHYSSMLVLVNDRQKEALKKAEQADDRFDREIETGKQDTSTPSDPFAVPAVPEPEEWALLLIVLVILTVTVIRRRKGVG